MRAHRLSIAPSQTAGRPIRARWLRNDIDWNFHGRSLDLSSYLKRSIMLVVASMALSHASTASAYDTTIFDEVGINGIDNPFDVGHGGMFDSGATDAPGTSGSSSEGGGDPSLEVSCAQLRINKPENCPNPIPYPSGYTFANDRLPGGSGIPKAIYFADHVSGVSATARITIHTALSRHTSELAGHFAPTPTAHATLLDSVSRACADQRTYDTPTRTALGLQITYQERKCLVVLERLTAEVKGAGFVAWFTEWLANNGVALSDLGIPQTVLDLASPANSLQIKNTIATREGKCAGWWHLVEYNKCAG
jgi:hypothetical protein